MKRTTGSEAAQDGHFKNLTESHHWGLTRAVPLPKLASPEDSNAAAATMPMLCSTAQIIFDFLLSSCHRLDVFASEKLSGEGDCPDVRTY